MMIRVIYACLLVLALDRPPIEGRYIATGVMWNTGGRSRHISTLTLNNDKTYVYTDVSFPYNLSFSENSIIGADTIKGEWYVTGDTLVTENYKMKWLVKKNSLVKLAVTRLRYKKDLDF